MGTLWFIRHGQASFGAENYDALSDKGFRQAEALGVYFARAGIKFDAVYAGSMKRQIDTAKRAMEIADHAMEPAILAEFNEYDFKDIINSQLPDLIKEDPSMAERSLNIFRDDATFVELFGILFKRWVEGTHNSAQIETFEAYKSRINHGIARVLKSNKECCNVAIFTSGGVLGVLLQMVLDLSLDITMETGWQICNASISRFEHTKNRLVMAGFNEISHLKIDGDQDLITYR